MFKSRRNYVVAAFTVLLAVASFAAGFLANEVVRLRAGSVRAAEEQQEFALFWEAWNWVESSYIGEIPPMQRITYGAIRGALGELGDPYTVFVEPPARENEKDSLRGSFGGIGAHITRNENGDVILDPIPGNPAANVGIQEGDILLAVDGRRISDTMTIEEVANLIRGEKGSTVRLTILQTGAAEPVDIEVVRGDILLPSVNYRLLQEAPTIGYIQLSRFSGESSNEIESALKDLQQQGARYLILDLRHNGGGLLDAAIDVADHFLEDGPILIQQSRGQEERLYEASEATVAGDIPLLILVDGGTASSSEILAGALQDRQRALLVGTKTFGKGSVQLVYDLSDGSSVHVTASRWLTPNRHQIDQQGLSPDIPVEISQDAIDSGQDVILNRAVDYFQNGMANGS
ncbi:MAG TPA: S41 family peptidase [Candidatus Binatia bacterium]|jgi:carboxyl-terminal processing protease|nr:S41 family peptidase [Candidatus Binatia bacterium]